MNIEKHSVGRVDALRSLLERLGAPDLTLSEAKVLRDRLLMLLSREDSSTELPSGSSKLVTLPNDRPTARQGGKPTHNRVCCVG